MSIDEHATTGAIGSAYEGYSWNGMAWVADATYVPATVAPPVQHQSFKLSPLPSKSPTGKRLLISILLTPVALAVGLFVYFFVGVLMSMSMASVGDEISQGAMMWWLVISVGGTIAGTWAIVWAAVRR